MKKALLTILFIAFAIAVFPQGMTDDGRCAPHKDFTTGMTRLSDEIGDFTVVDSDGISHNLYDELDAGNTVLIDLFFSS